MESVKATLCKHVKELKEKNFSLHVKEANEFDCFATECEAKERYLLCLNDQLEMTAIFERKIKKIWRLLPKRASITKKEGEIIVRKTISLL